MMKILTFLCLALVAMVNSRSPRLKWPEKYSFEITKISVKSGLVEDIKFWKSSTQTRSEYNHGAVKKFCIKSKGRWSDGRNIEIHPETSADGSDGLVCNILGRWDYTGPENVLPGIDGFKEIGEDMMKDLKCTKFTLEQVSEYIETKATLWASYDTNLKAWIPARYELLQYNTWLGYNDRHEIWDFDNFHSDFDDKEIFDAQQFCQKSDPIRHNIHDEAVTKHLLFMDPDNETHVNHVFNSFKKKYNKEYAEEEHALRKSVFQNNMRLVTSTNRKNLGYKLAVNRFADRLPSEMRKHTGLLRRAKGDVATDPFPYSETHVKELASKLPAEHDLRLLGLISPIENQESCGSCWTFGTTAAVEGALARHNGGNLMKLSNQALIDCAWEFGAAGCDGGTDAAAYSWMKKYGMPTEADYGTYADQDGYCLISNMTETYPIRGFVDVTPNSVGSLKLALFEHGPLSVSAHVNGAFSMYSSGIFYDLDCSSTELNHEITLVGYGSLYGDTFWIVKNSWGPEWGIDGYMHISARDNNCGIMTEPTYVLL